MPNESNPTLCHGVLPLRARIEPWMEHVCSGGVVHEWVQEHGSPLNILQSAPLERNIRKLNETAAQRQLDFQVFFARKANKCLTFVDAANQTGAGIDVASHVELRQTLSRGIQPERVICTAAVKDRDLLKLCAETGVTVAVDNTDELNTLSGLAGETAGEMKLALRVSGFAHRGSKLESRFGFDVDEVLEVVQQFWPDTTTKPLRITGVHFHLPGYSAEHRVAGITQSLRVIDRLRELGHRPEFLDMGGGIPMSYLESQTEWDLFWQEHRRALLGQRDPVTYANHGLGLVAAEGKVHGKPHCYPYFQRSTQAQWLASVLDAEWGGETISDGVRRRGLQLRCEPGRSVLDGCGMTVARVEFRKRHRDGHWLIGLSMNRTQCRTTSDDFLVDPLLVRSIRSEPQAAGESGACEGYLVGAYCTETELLLERKLCFPAGVRLGDLFVFPNTAGYLMHFLESRSHQFPLAKNLFVGSHDDGHSPRIDAIDLASKHEG